MGQANYYLKARFESPEKASDALPKIATFIVSGQKAETYWQSNRGRPSDQFWPQFDAEFPVVAEYLKSFGKHGGDCNNTLARYIDFGTEGEEEPEICMDSAVILFSACVWHFADWAPFCRFLGEKFGATAADWLSDEYADLFAALDV
jgi:hypothetical protein